MKQEKINPKYDNLDNNGNRVTKTEEEDKEKEKSQVHKDEVAEGDTEENKDETGDAENTPKKPRKNSKKNHLWLQLGRGLSDQLNQKQTLKLST